MHACVCQSGQHVRCWCLVLRLFAGCSLGREVGPVSVERLCDIVPLPASAHGLVTAAACSYCLCVERVPLLAVQPFTADSRFLRKFCCRPPTLGSAGILALAGVLARLGFVQFLCKSPR